jgi:hypothetical protein
MDLSDPELDQLASRLRTTFCQRWRREVPNHKLSDRHRSLKHWRGPAKLMYEHDADPIEWVEAAFTYNTIPNGPFVTQLGGKAIVRWYRDYRETNVYGQDNVSVAGFVQECFNQLRFLLERNLLLPEDEQQTEEEIILDEFNRVRPFVAVCALPKNEKIIKKYLTDAKAFVRGSPIILDAIESCGFKTDVLR